MQGRLEVGFEAGKEATPIRGRSRSEQNRFVEWLWEIQMQMGNVNGIQC